MIRCCFSASQRGHKNTNCIVKEWWSLPNGRSHWTFFRCCQSDNDNVIFKVNDPNEIRALVLLTSFELFIKLGQYAFGCWLIDWNKICSSWFYQCFGTSAYHLFALFYDLLHYSLLSRIIISSSFRSFSYSLWKISSHHVLILIHIAWPHSLLSDYPIEILIVDLNRRRTRLNIYFC